MRRGSPGWVPILLVPTSRMAPGGGGDGGGRGSTPTPDVGPDFSGAALWLPFDETATGEDGVEQVPASSGAPDVAGVVQANGGEVTQVDGPEGRGSALQFPGVCDAATGCPMASLPPMTPWR